MRLSHKDFDALPVEMLEAQTDRRSLKTHLLLDALV